MTMATKPVGASRVGTRLGMFHRLLFGTTGPTLGRGMIPDVLVHVVVPDAVQPWDDPRWGTFWT